MIETKNLKRILLAEDDDEMRKLIKRALQHQGYEVTECMNGYELFARLLALVESGQCLNHDLIVSDIRMPGWTGLEIFEGVHKYEECPPVILITAFGDKDTHTRAQQLGVAAVFDKPFEIADLLNKINEIVALNTDNEHKNYSSSRNKIKAVDFPLEIIYRHDALHSAQNDRVIHKNASKLNAFHDRIDSCRVVVDIPHHHHRENLYDVEVILWVSGQELVADREPDLRMDRKNIYVAVKEAFKAVERQLKDYLDQHEKSS
jgi:CheY-like chemotaxis protein/ribosome-associated translation inhibitor RaiA